MTKVLTAAEDIANIKSRLDEVFNGRDLNLNRRNKKLFEKHVNKSLNKLYEKASSLDQETKKKFFEEIQKAFKDAGQKIVDILKDRNTYKTTLKIISTIMLVIFGLIAGVVELFVVGAAVVVGGKLGVIITSFSTQLITAITTGTGITGIVTTLISKIFGGIAISAGLIILIKFVVIAAIGTIVAGIIWIAKKTLEDHVIVKYVGGLIIDFHRKLRDLFGFDESKDSWVID